MTTKLSEFQKHTALLLGLESQEMAPLSEDQMKSLYIEAFRLYENKKYRKAAHLFTQLVLTNPFSEAFWTGLASSKQMTRDYEAALHGWALVSLLNEQNPIPHFHAAECYLSLEDKQEAWKALESAFKLAQGDNDLQERIQALKSLHY